MAEDNVARAARILRGINPKIVTSDITSAVDALTNGRYEVARSLLADASTHYRTEYRRAARTAQAKKLGDALYVVSGRRGEDVVYDAWQACQLALMMVDLQLAPA